MFVVGDFLELDLESDLNKGFGDVEDELAFLERCGLVPNNIYKLERILEEVDDEAYDLPPLVVLEGVNLSWSSERFKLAAPLELENE